VPDTDAGGPWTRHGHPVPGVTVAPANPADRPPVHRCGGVRICDTCRDDAERIRAEHRPAVLGDQTPPPSTRTEPDEEARRHPLHRVIVAALSRPEGYTRDPIIRVWGRVTTDHLVGIAGNAWAGTPEDVADHLVRAVVENLPQVDGGRYLITPTLPVPADPPPDLTTDPVAAERRSRAAFLRRLVVLAGDELQPATVHTGDGDPVHLVTRDAVTRWLEGLVVRAVAGEDL